MPEGHTLHALARDHHRWFARQPVAVTSPQGRFTHAARLDGVELTRAEAYGKHLFHHYASGDIVHIHLGLGGKFFDHPSSPPPQPRSTVRYRVSGPHHTVDLVGPTVCEVIDGARRDAIVDRLGPDPIRPRSQPLRSLEALRRRRVVVGRALLDQAVIAGVGNVYRAEVLHVHKIHPHMPLDDVSDELWLNMWNTLQTWMRRAVRERTIITIDPAAFGLRRSDASHQRLTYVYGQLDCRSCGAAVRRWNLAERTAHACEACQPPPGA